MDLNFSTSPSVQSLRVMFGTSHPAGAQENKYREEEGSYTGDLRLSVGIGTF
jgi:hypothetical protein